MRTMLMIIHIARSCWRLDKGLWDDRFLDLRAQTWSSHHSLTFPTAHLLFPSQMGTLSTFRQQCRLTICMEFVELTNSVSDNKIQMTLLILKRGALSNVKWTLGGASCHLDSTEICIPFKVCFANYCAKYVAGYNYVGSTISPFVRNLIKSWNWAEARELLPLFANNISLSGKRNVHNHDVGNHDFFFFCRTTLALATTKEVSRRETQAQGWRAGLSDFCEGWHENIFCVEKKYVSIFQLALYNICAIASEPIQFVQTKGGRRAIQQLWQYLSQNFQFEWWQTFTFWFLKIVHKGHIRQDVLVIYISWIVSMH